MFLKPFGLILKQRLLLVLVVVVVVVVGRKFKFAGSDFEKVKGKRKERGRTGSFFLWITCNHHPEP